MNNHRIFPIIVLSLLVWLPTNAATLQPTLRTSPTMELKTIEPLPIILIPEEKEETVIDDIKIAPDFTPELIETIEIGEEVNVPTIIPIQIEEEPPKMEPEPKLTLETKTETMLEITKEVEPELIQKEEPLLEIQQEQEETDLIPEFEAIIEPIEILKEADKFSNLTTEITEEEDGTLKYKLKTVDHYPIYKSDASGKEDIISLAPKKEIKFSPSDKSFLVEEKEEYDYADLMKEEEDFSMGFEKFTATPKDDCLELSFNENSANKLSLCEDFDLREDGLFLPGETEEEDILLPPLDIFYDEIKLQFEKQEADLLDIKLVTDESGKPQYEINVEEDRKFLWLIPVTIQAKIRLSVEDNSTVGVDYGWSGLFFSNRDYITEIQILPNLVITNVEVSPKTLHNGDKMNVAITVKNVGLKRSYASYTSEGGPSRIALYFGENQATEIQDNDSGFFLDPGESETQYLSWNAIICNSPFNIIADPDNRIEEAKEGDNQWNGTVKCLPTNAPDLVVSSINFGNGLKKVGQPTKLNYTIKNQGSEPSPEFTSFFEWGGGYSSSILVPALPAGQSHSGSFTYTPNNCTGAVLKLDTSDIILENDEDNNLGYEPDSQCTWRPDLFVDFVWWKANGVTAGEIHAGEPLWFQVKVKNDPETYVTDAACVNSFTGVVKNNGTTIKTLNFGNIGCIPNYSNNHPDFWVEKAEFTYVPQCNGEHLTVQIDPTNAVPESLENNNSWTFDVVCTLPPPVVTPN